MLDRNGRLELTWTGKHERPNPEPCELVEDKAVSYTKGEGPAELCDNRLIHGENLQALQPLLQELSGQIKCIYIDPPYNTGNVFEHYDDGVAHVQWLQGMRDRLLCLRELLRPDGFLCCHIDDSEGHYLKVLLDEIFGRRHYFATLYVQVRYANKTLKQHMPFHKQIEYVHVYRKDASAKPNLPVSEADFSRFKFQIRELASARDTVSLGGKRVDIFQPGDFAVTKAEGSRDGLKEIWASGTILDGNSSGRFFRDHLSGRVASDGLGVLYKVHGIGDDRLGYRYFTGPQRVGATKGKYFQGVPLDQLDPSDPLNTASTLRTQPIENFYDLAGPFGNCRLEGGVEFRAGKKPEALLERLVTCFSDRGDWVLDAFAGSGTTGAVAHKLGRRWIMIEQAEQCLTHVLPRMRSVVDGADATGITASARWQGGGGFRFFEVKPAAGRQCPSAAQ